MNNYEAQYRKEISSYLKCGEDNIYFYWKGRVALYALLKAMGVGPGDEVIVQGYTCVVVANSIIYLGAKPVYVDIDRDTYNMNIEQMKEKITDKTKVIICQNTYGLSSNLEVLEQIAKEKCIYTLEDCTHGFGGYYNGKPNGTSCDASFFSTQWSKPYTTGIGGFCVVHDEGLREKLGVVNKDLVDPSWKECMEAKGRWIAFLDSDDLWMPEKLEKQVSFMEKNGYSFSYTNYEEIDVEGNSTGVKVTGPKKVTKTGMFNYCWLGCLTVMYDRNVIGLIQIEDIKKNNDYAMWLKVCKRVDCYLLDEYLGKYRKGRAGSVSTHSITTMIGWHYKLFREAEKQGTVRSIVNTGRNLAFGFYKKKRYVKHL